MTDVVIVTHIMVVPKKKGTAHDDEGCYREGNKDDHIRMCLDDGVLRSRLIHWSHFNSQPNSTASTKRLASGAHHGRSVSYTKRQRFPCCTYKLVMRL